MEKVPQWIKILSRIYRPDKSFLMDREAVEKPLRQIKESLMDRECAKSVEKGSPRGSIDKNLSRICREAIELEEKEFLKERKNT